VVAPELTFFYSEEKETWHLAYFFTNVPVPPPELLEEEEEEEWIGFGHGGLSPRISHAEFNYLVDAHDGSILLYYSSHPMIDVPVKCRGLDETDTEQIFWGQNIDNGFCNIILP
jgi:hypothetical protein